LAIEPQKFSAATTLTPVVLALEIPPQPASAAATIGARRRAWIRLIVVRTAYHQDETESRNYSRFGEAKL
jgi:hypothetical protein